MEKIKVAFLFGGCSSEYDVSLVSAVSVIKNIEKEKYEILMIGITRDGNFYLYDGDVDSIGNDEWFRKDTCRKVTFSCNRSDHGFVIAGTGKVVHVDIVFPILHGKNGEDGRLQGMLELAGIPYVGCQMTSSAICMDKYIAHKLVESYGILTPKSLLFTRYDEIGKILKGAEELNYPVFVKPLKAGSSFGISKVKDKDKLTEAVRLAFSYDDNIIIEEEIDGFEVGCAVLGNDQLVIGEVDEIELQSGFFDYEEKYTLKNSKIILPARLDLGERQRIKNMALKIYQILGCKGFARVDMFYNSENEIVFNEVNTIPGCTAHSRYPAMLKEIGVDFKEMIHQLINLGLEM